MGDYNFDPSQYRLVNPGQYSLDNQDPLFDPVSFLQQPQSNPNQQSQSNLNQFGNRLSEWSPDFRQMMSKPIYSMGEQKQFNNLDKAGFDYAQQFHDQNKPLMNQMKFNTGLGLLKSDDPLNQMNGQKLISQSTNLDEVDLSGGSGGGGEGKKGGGLSPDQWGAISGAIDGAQNASDMMFGQKQGMDSKRAHLTTGVDSAYDTAADTVMKFNPMVGAIMKGAGFVGNAINKIGGGTDGMTSADALLNSNIGTFLTLGLNGFLGDTTDSFSKNNEVFAQLGASQTGTNALTDMAMDFQGKKYGAVSSNARKDANALISEAKRQQNAAEDMSSLATTRFDLAQSMSAINGNRRAFDMQGGYRQNAVHVGRHGMVLQNLQIARQINTISKYAKGGKNEDPFVTFVNSLPENQRADDQFNVRRYWELNGKPKNFKEAIKRGMYSLEDDGWHAHTVQYNPDTDEYEFMKASNHSTLQYELDWYNSDHPDAIELRKEYELVKTEPYYKYVRRKETNQPQTFREGGNITKSNWLVEVNTNTLPTEFLESSLTEINIENILPEFKEGGKFNIIPEGALHARKHNMDIEGITTKGIPVVSQSKDGELEQQAEIEREEIILRLEVTKKLEELQKKFDSSEYSQKEKDEFAIEAGKLLVEEILYNTIDNTNNLI